MRGIGARKLKENVRAHGENGARILRTWDYEFKQGVEDFDYEMLMFPPSHSTRWNLY